MPPYPYSPPSLVLPAQPPTPKPLPQPGLPTQACSGQPSGGQPPGRPPHYGALCASSSGHGQQLYHRPLNDFGLGHVSTCVLGARAGDPRGTTAMLRLGSRGAAHPPHGSSLHCLKHRHWLPLPASHLLLPSPQFSPTVCSWAPAVLSGLPPARSALSQQVLCSHLLGRSLLLSLCQHLFLG